MSDDCGYIKENDEPCQLPACRSDGLCWHHTESEPRADGGRPTKLTDDKKESVYNAVRLGMTVKHQAAIAGVHPDTLRRAACCVDTLRNPELTEEEPCDFCEGYVRAHGRGAQNVLAECSPEFRASATFGYVKAERREHTGKGGAPVQIEFNEEIVETSWGESE